MGRKVTIRTGYPGAEKDVTVEIHDLDAEPWGLDAKLRVVGTDVPRVDGLAKATGAARYAFDVNRPNLAYAKLLRCFRAHAKVVSLDLSAAKGSPGVLAVEPMIDVGGRVTFSGQPVAAVCAETPEALDDALAAIAVKYETLPCAVTTDDAMKDGAPQVDPNNANVFAPPPEKRGDVEKGLAAAEVVVEGEFRTKVQTHSALEPHGCVVEPDADGKFTVWASTQSVDAFHGGMTRVLGAKPEQVRVLTEFMGGGFGAKFGIDEWDAVTARFAKQLGRPVKQMLDRRAEHLAAGNRPDSIQRMKLGAKRDGTLTALAAETFVTSGNGRGGGVANSRVYRIPNVLVKQNSVATFTGSGRAFRAPGHPPGVYALEGILDVAAEKLGMDPLALRLMNDPHPLRQIQWKLGAERIGWSANRRAKPGSDAGPVKRGLGCAAAIWYQKGGGNWVVDLRVDRSGHVLVQNGTQDIGTGTKTVMAILVAEELGIAPDRVTVQIGDSAFPKGPGSGGSTTAPSIGPEAREAALRAREALVALLAAEWKCKPEEVRLGTAGGFAGPDGKTTTFEGACSLLGPEGLSVSGQRRPNYDGFSGETAGCQFAQVAVDVETGVVKVERVVAVHDAGRIVDTLTARSQVIGGVIQGVSYALYEDRRLDRNLGDMVNPTLDTYKVTGMLDCPEIDVVLTSVASGFNNVGMMGLGEPATVPTAAAVANAVANATGARVFELPITPARVLAALRGGK